MRLKSLKVKGIKNLNIPSDEDDFDRLKFPKEGKIFIHGLNESGKSTLFESIFFALFGKPLVPNRSKRSLSELLSYNREKGFVELEFIIDDNIYQVRRSIEDADSRMKYGHELIIRRPGQEPEGIKKATQVNKRIRQELGLDEDALLNSCFVQQKNLDRLENSSRSDREESISKLLNLDSFTGMQNKYEKKYREIEDSLENARDKLELAKVQNKIPMKDEKKEEVEEKLEVIDWKEEIQTKGKKIDEQKERIEEIREEEIREIREEIEKIEKLEEKLPEKKERYKKLDDLHSKIQEWEETDNRAKKWGNKIERFREWKKEIRNSINDLENDTKEIEEIEEELPKKKERKEALGNLYDNLKDLEEIKEEIKDKKSELESLRTIKSALEEIGEIEPKLETIRGKEDLLKYWNFLGKLKNLFDVTERKEEHEERLEEVQDELGDLEEQEKELDNKRKVSIGTGTVVLLASIAGGVLVSTLIFIGSLIGGAILFLGFQKFKTTSISSEIASKEQEKEGKEDELKKIEGMKENLIQEEDVSLDEKIEEVKGNIASIDFEVPNNPDECEVLIEDKGEKLAEIESMEELEAKEKKLENRKTTLEEKINNAQGDLSDDYDNFEIERIGEDIETLDEEKESLKKEKADLENKIKKASHKLGVETDKSRVNSKKSSLQSEIKSDKKNVGEKEDKEREIKEKRKHIEERVVELTRVIKGEDTKLEGRARSETLDDYNAIIKELEEEKKELDQQAEEKLEAIKEKADKLSVEPTEENVNSVKSSLYEEIRHDKEEIEKKEEYEENIQNKKERIESLSKKIQEKSERIEELKDNIEESQFDPEIEEEEKLSDERDDLIGTIRHLKEKRNELKEELDIDEKLDLDAVEEEIEKREQEVKVYDYAIEIVSSAKKDIMSEILPKTEANMARFLPILTANRYKDVEIDPESYSIKVFDSRAQKKKSKGIFSGGTKDQFSLALRLSFAMATLPQERGVVPDFLFLDEPVESFDSERQESLSELLTRGEIADNFSQVFIISHVKGLKSSFDKHIKMADGEIAEMNI